MQHQRCDRTGEQRCACALPGSPKPHLAMVPSCHRLSVAIRGYNCEIVRRPSAPAPAGSQYQPPLPLRHNWMASMAQSPPLEFVQLDSATHCQPWYL